MRYIQSILLTTLVLFLFTGSGLAHAANTAALSTDYTQRVPARIGHGFMNTVFGWTDLGLAPYHAKQRGAGNGDAFARAITQPFATTFLGIWDLATFWVPGETGRSMAVPRHVWMAPVKPAAVETVPPQETEADELLALTSEAL